MKNFDNYKPISSADFEIASAEKPKKKGFFDKVGSFFEETGKKIEKTYKKIETKIDGLKIGDKIKLAGEKTKNAFISAGDSISDSTHKIVVL